MCTFIFQSRGSCKWFSARKCKTKNIKTNFPAIAIAISCLNCATPLRHSHRTKALKWSSFDMSGLRNEQNFIRSAKVVRMGPPSRSFARIASAATLMPGIAFKSSVMGDKMKTFLYINKVSLSIVFSLNNQSRSLENLQRGVKNYTLRNIVPTSFLVSTQHAILNIASRIKILT